jgi:hypothetical protein
LLPALSLAAPPDDPTYIRFGPQLLAGLEARSSGDVLLGELGVRLFGLRALDDRRWLQLFDGELGFRGGVLANQHPYTDFFGGRISADFEQGYRFSPGQTWSPFLSARANARLQVMGHPGLPLSQLNLINSSDGFGGITLDGNVRVSGGFSLLNGGQSLLLTAFVQEALRAPRLTASGAAFTEFGLSLRSDGSRSFVIGVEALGGLTPTATNSELAFTEQSFRLEASGFLRKMFENGLWLGLSVSYGRDSHHQLYTQSKTAFDTINAPDFSALLSFGFAPWRTP